MRIFSNTLALASLLVGTAAPVVTSHPEHAKPVGLNKGTSDDAPKPHILFVLVDDFGFVFCDTFS